MITKMLPDVLEMNGGMALGRYKSGTEVAELDLKELEARCNQYHDSWYDTIVDCSNGKNFTLTEDRKFRFKGEDGKDREADITSFAFSQLCSRIGKGGLATYMQALFEDKMENLAFQNFNEWADKFNGKLLVREANGVVRAVLSDKYSPFDSNRVVKTLRQTVNPERYSLVGTCITSDRTHLRFISKTPLKAGFDNSKLYSGFTVNSSDVGKAGLSMKYFVFRQVCTNGMIANKHGGTLFTQYHVGDEMTSSKIIEFNKALLNAHRLDDKFLQVSELAHTRKLKDYEYANFLESVKREAKLSKESKEKLDNLIDTRYDRSMWGVLNGVTELAHNFNLDTRMELEELATNRLFSIR